MPESLHLNLHPLHQAAKQHLRSLGVLRWTNQLYALQLMSWRLESVVPHLQLEDQLPAMLDWDPKVAHQVLLDLQHSPDALRLLSPTQASDSLLESLHQYLASRVPSYQLR